MLYNERLLCHGGSVKMQMDDLVCSPMEDVRTEQLRLEVLWLRSRIEQMKAKMRREELDKILGSPDTSQRN